jgi:hypothetical protein
VRERTLRFGNERAYEIWKGMKKRCLVPTSSRYAYYGARGIQVHEPWAQSGSCGFKAFINDVGLPPSDQHSIDRIDNNGNYEPGNVKWSTRKEQARNKRNNKIVTVGGSGFVLSELAEMSGIKRETISVRLKLGWNEGMLLSTPRGKGV